MSTAQETKTRAVNLTDEEIKEIRACIGAAWGKLKESGEREPSAIDKLTAAGSATWQDTAPAEDGRYWWRSSRKRKPVEALIFHAYDTRYAYSQDLPRQWVLTDRKDGQWWPIPICQPPD